jgi:hypothetical protein
MAIQVLIGGDGGARAGPRIPFTGKGGEKESRERKGVFDLILRHVTVRVCRNGDARGQRRGS